jgi:copper chaperone
MINFDVPGMTCGHCAHAITNAVREIDPAAEVHIDLPSKSVAISSEAQSKRLKTAIQDAGYDVTAKAA